MAWRRRCTVVLRAWHRHTQRQQLLQLGVQQLQRVWAARRAALVLHAWRTRVQQVQQHQVASATLAAADRWAALLQPACFTGTCLACFGMAT